MRALLLPLLLLAVGVANASQQDLYRWTDDQGVTHYSDEKPIDRTSSPIVLAPLKVIPSPQPTSTLMVKQSQTAPARGSNMIEEADLAALELNVPDDSRTSSTSARHTITVYSWTDEEGVRHYGNNNSHSAPPSTVEHPASPAPSGSPSD